MKKIISSLICAFILGPGNVGAQDIIKLKDKSFIQAKVLDTSANEIVFKEFFNQSGPNLSLRKTEIFSVQFEGGNLISYKDFIPVSSGSKVGLSLSNDKGNLSGASQNNSLGNNKQDSSQTIQAYVSKGSSNKQDKPIKEIDYFSKGKADAKKYYKSYREPAALTFGISAVPIYGIVLGVVPAIITSNVSPSGHHLDCPNISNLENQAYSRGYRQEAKRIKQKKVWLCYGTGAATGIVAIILLISILV